ncbi:RagB/SusD family nutrient uptake outer membrane protein [Mangrovibacterium marinum]|uniref:SusD-like starch-binding protein associating with outer membrane n=1 Tax=Mangrovibacterium marinum TaxID=1639118 RepID=A0A2T5C1G0_9BACT|nr:RagB/SusD family nutrient uptake outer membrane protein [Mangrovibacterium marinum]PTN08490.1 SusD-like starch-binding protein associating with outer membrane [Mangrovibacterium marinum]
MVFVETMTWCYVEIVICKIVEIFRQLKYFGVALLLSSSSPRGVCMIYVYVNSRYADVLLMLAEAYTRTGQVAKAAPQVHRVRNRALLTDKLSEMIQYSEDEMMQEIRRQRNLEFAREGLHFYDLRRWGLLESTIKNAKQLGYQNYTSKWSALAFFNQIIDFL